jgi:hypothetical protein
MDNEIRGIGGIRLLRMNGPRTWYDGGWCGFRSRDEDGVRRTMIQACGRKGSRKAGTTQ